MNKILILLGFCAKVYAGYIVDPMSINDKKQYQIDLNTCSEYAQDVKYQEANPNANIESIARNSVAGATAGAISSGFSKQDTKKSARYGAAIGASTAVGQSYQRNKTKRKITQNAYEQVMRKCLSQKGYEFIY